MDAAEYYKLRLQHTIDHLNQATRLIYFVSGAAVAMLYFVLEKMKGAPAQRAFGVGLILLVGILFSIHGRFIQMQDSHYKEFDALLAHEVGQQPKPRRFILGTGLIYACLHWIVAAFAFIAAAYFLCTGDGI